MLARQSVTSHLQGAHVPSLGKLPRWESQFPWCPPLRQASATHRGACVQQESRHSRGTAPHCLIICLCKSQPQAPSKAASLCVEGLRAALTSEKLDLRGSRPGNES